MVTWVLSSTLNKIKRGWCVCKGVNITPESMSDRCVGGSWRSVPDRDTEKRQITGALSNNGYSMGLVRRHWHPTPHSAPGPEPDTSKAMIVIPYSWHLSESIRWILALSEIHTCNRPHHTLRQALLNLKDHVPLQQRAGVIYRIPAMPVPGCI